MLEGWSPKPKEVHRCLVDDRVLEWDELRELWVDFKTGQTYPPVDE